MSQKYNTYMIQYSDPEVVTGSLLDRKVRAKNRTHAKEVFEGLVVLKGRQMAQFENNKIVQDGIVIWYVRDWA